MALFFTPLYAFDGGSVVRTYKGELSSNILNFSNYVPGFQIVLSVVISESMYRKSNCSQLGDYTLLSKLRTTIATAIIKRVYREDANNPLVGSAKFTGFL